MGQTPPHHTRPHPPHQAHLRRQCRDALEDHRVIVRAHRMVVRRKHVRPAQIPKAKRAHPFVGPRHAEAPPHHDWDGLGVPRVLLRQLEEGRLELRGRRAKKMRRAQAFILNVEIYNPHTPQQPHPHIHTHDNPPPTYPSNGVKHVSAPAARNWRRWSTHESMSTTRHCRRRRSRKGRK